MKIFRIVGIILIGGAMHGYGQIVVAVDMDTGTPGIQSVRLASPGDMFTVALVLTVGPGGVSSYGISALFDSTELLLNGSLVPTDPMSAALEATPAMMANFTAGVTEESNMTTGMPGMGHVYTYEAFGTGPGFTGPANASFTIGTIAFSVSAANFDGIPDITLGFFNAGVDGAFDNAGGAIMPTFLFGQLIPEPASVALTLFGAALLFALQRFRRAH